MHLHYKRSQSPLLYGIRMPDTSELLTLTADIVSSHVANNAVAVGDLPTLINNVYASLAGLGSGPRPVEAKQVPPVSIRASIKPDYLVCLEDGKKLKMLKRHLMTSYGMTPDAYRTKWSLPMDYPMVAPNYAAQRRSLAIKIGLGSKRDGSSASALVEARSAPSDAVPALVAAAPKAKRGRPAKQAREVVASPSAPKPVRRRKASPPVEMGEG